jgi:hypothetical protein
VADRPGLLKEQPPDLCAKCHLDPFLLSQKFHSRDDVDACTSCHDPHFGDKFRVRPAAPIADLQRYLSSQTLQSTEHRR